MLLPELGSYLTSSAGFTVGTDLTLGMMPDSPDAIATLYEAPGREPAHTMGNIAGQAALEFPAVKVDIRGAATAGGYAAARLVASRLFLALDGLPTRTIDGVAYKYAKARQSPYLYGRDGNERPKLTFTVDVAKMLSTS